MRLQLILTLLILLLGRAASAQIQVASSKSVPDKDVYRFKSGTDLNRAIPFAEQFQYDQFVDGQALNRNGRLSKGKFNYSLVHGEIMFISPARDTMLLSQPEFMKQVRIGNDLYYFQKGQGHVQVIGDFGKVRLGRKLYIARLGDERYASYEQYSSASAITSYSTYSNANGELKFLEGRDNIIMKRRSVYYLVDQNNNLVLANRAGFSKVFASDKGKVGRFLRDNMIDLENEADLRKTLEYCSTLR